MMPTKSSRNTGLALAVLPISSAVIFLAAILVTAAMTPGYSHTSQFISELGATGAQYEWAFRLLGFLPTGVLLLGFCAIAYSVLPRSRGATIGLVGLAMFAAGYLVSLVFPCDPGCRPEDPSTAQVIHNAFALFSYVPAPGFLFLLARASRTSPGSLAVELTGYLAALVALTSLTNLDPNSATAGLSQRALETAVLGWTSLWGIQLSRQRSLTPEKANHID